MCIVHRPRCLFSKYLSKARFSAKFAYRYFLKSTRDFYFVKASLRPGSWVDEKNSRKVRGTVYGTSSLCWRIPYVYRGQTSLFIFQISFERAFFCEVRVCTGNSWKVGVTFISSKRVWALGVDGKKQEGPGSCILRYFLTMWKIPYVYRAQTSLFIFQISFDRAFFCQVLVLREEYTWLSFHQSEFELWELMDTPKYKKSHTKTVFYLKSMSHHVFKKTAKECQKSKKCRISGCS